MSPYPSLAESVTAIWGFDVFWLKGDAGPVEPSEDNDDSRL
jgi:hypothetical protein